MEPFIPIEIPSYSDKELMNQYEYFKDRNWLQNPESLTDQGREELVFLSGKNPFEFMRVCQSIWFDNLNLLFCYIINKIYIYLYIHFLVSFYI